MPANDKGHYVLRWKMFSPLIDVQDDHPALAGEPLLASGDVIRNAATSEYMRVIKRVGSTNIGTPQYRVERGYHSTPIDYIPALTRCYLETPL